jgi:hypothetical protein
MREPELTSIIDRLKHEVDANSIYAKQIELLIDLVNYGSNLIARAYSTSKRNIDDIMIIAVLLKDVVQMLDGIQVLISAGNSHAATLQARSAFEAYVCMLWIMKGDSIRKARFYYVFEIRKQRKWALRVTPNTKERERFNEIYKDYNSSVVDWDQLAKMGRKNLSAIDSILAQPPLKEINETIERTNRLDWYKCFNVKLNSIRDLAVDVGELAIYDLYYTRFSDVMHASSYRDQIEIKNKYVLFEPIRMLSDAPTVILLCCHVAILGYKTILNRYLKSELLAFTKKYMSDWRDASRYIPSIDYRLADD